ncbi:MAG: hypothetical protein SGJ10_11975 [Bacteroidota bacterium]|nr:hypothetical protein [Bacteroidota bacterium]
MKNAIIIIILLISQASFAQKNVQLSHSFQFVTATDSVTIARAALKKIPLQKLPDLRLTNHQFVFN